MRDSNTLAEIQRDHESQQALAALEREADAQLPTVKQEIAAGEYDSDLASYFDSIMLMRIARRLATEVPQNQDDINEIRLGLEDYTKDLADRKALRAMT